MTQEKTKAAAGTVGLEQEAKAAPELPQAGTDLARSPAELARKEREDVDKMLQEKMGLSMAQIIVLEQLADGRSVTQAARKAQVHNGTIYRWMHHHAAFMKQQETLKRNLCAAAENRLVGMIDRSLDTVDEQIGRGDGRLAFDLLREMKVTPKSKESSMVASPKAGHCETVVERVHERLSVSTGGSGEAGERRKEIEGKA